MYVRVGRQMRRPAGKPLRQAGRQAGSQAAMRNQAAASSQPTSSQPDGQPSQPIAQNFGLSGTGAARAEREPARPEREPEVINATLESAVQVP